MGNIFNIDSPIMQFLSRVFDLIILNLLFVLGCIPIVTIGASLSALYYVSLKMARKEDPYIWRNFWKAFRSNFKQSTIVWLIFVLAFIVLGIDFRITAVSATKLFTAVRIGLLIVCVFTLCIFIYIFPIISHFVCTVSQSFKNALLMSIAHLPFSLLLLGMHGVILYFASKSVKVFAFLLSVSWICLFSVIAYISCLIFSRIFKFYEPKEAPEEIKDEAESEAELRQAIKDLKGEE